MREVIVGIWSQPFQPNTPMEHHATIVARLYYAGNKVVKVETDSLHPYAGFAMSDLLRQLLGKTATRDSYETKVPRSIVEQHRIAGQMQEQMKLEIWSEPKPLKLELGKKYRRLDGVVTGALTVTPEHNPNRPDHPFYDPTHYRSYRADGHYAVHDETSQYDLVEEACTTQPEVEATTDLMALTPEVKARLVKVVDSLSATVRGDRGVEEKTTTPPTAADYLHNAASIMEERGRQYDQPGGERSMGKCVHAFNTITGHELTEAEGWLLLQLLKDVRQWQRKGFHKDSADDCIAYAALKAEAKQREGV